MFALSAGQGAGWEVGAAVQEVWAAQGNKLLLMHGLFN